MKASLLYDNLCEATNDNFKKNAVIYGKDSITYSELINKCNYVSLQLQNIGVKKGDICAVFCERNIETVIAMITIFNIGAVYVPLNANDPVDRNMNLMTESGANIFIYSNSNLDINRLQIDGIKLFDITNSMKAYESYKLYIINKIEIFDNDIAYIIFTSGSTGKPKGVQVTYGNMMYLLNGLKKKLYEDKENLKICLTASFSFDASMQQILPSLYLGHTLFITQEEERKDPNKLMSFVINNEINIMDCTPAHVRLINKAYNANEIDNKHLEVMIIGGEVLTGKIVKELGQRFKVKIPKIVNAYGITECTVDSFLNVIDTESIIDNGPLPIGKPLDKVKYLILNEDMAPVKNGEEGILYIGGDGISMGYIDKRLDHEVFINISPQEDGVMYKTGDVAVLTDKCDIIVLGRKDSQVKVNGFRVELSEIEAAILDYNSHILDGNDSYCCNCVLDNSNAEIIDGVCENCKSYYQLESRISGIFKSKSELLETINSSNIRNSNYDCMLLYSGGKDSTYVLMQLKNMGLNVLTYTFDNGYISEEAIDNIKNLTIQLGVDNVTESFNNMNCIFKESLDKFSTVCDGCFKVLTTLSTEYAVSNGINVIITGLDRGQLLETKYKHLLMRTQSDMKDLEEVLMGERLVYHMNMDFSIQMRCSIDSVKRIKFLDYFLYDDINKNDLITFLEKNSIWKQSVDTGSCSSNCLINDAGIYVHTKEKKYHNYAKPLSWSVRMNLISRQDALKAINTETLNFCDIKKTLDKLEYNSYNTIKDCVVVYKNVNSNNIIVAFIVLSNDMDTGKLKNYLVRKLPSYMIPHYYIVTNELPLTNNGKIDYDYLHDMFFAYIQQNNICYEEKTEESEIKILRKMWENILGHSNFSNDDSFFDIGGDSLTTLLLIADINKRFNKKFGINDVMKALTINSLSNKINCQRWHLI